MLNSLSKCSNVMRGSEKDLVGSEHYYRTLIHSLHENLLVIDRDFRITDIKNMSLKNSAKTHQEVMGRLCHEVSHDLNEPCIVIARAGVEALDYLYHLGTFMQCAAGQCKTAITPTHFPR